MSFLKGFLSLFDWMFPPKSYQELTDDLDNKMQDLYDRCGWGKYNNPLKGYQNAVDINRVLEADISYSIHSVYTDENGDIVNISEKPSYTIGDDTESLKWQLQRMTEACNKPVIDYNTGEQL